VAPTTERPGLRERKKQRTRQTIVDVAVRLFAEQGYDETTLVQIADAADIAPSTFFNYFGSKVDVVFGLLDAVIASARARVVERPAGEATTQAVLAWIAHDLPVVEAPYVEALRSIPRVVAAVPELRAEERLRQAVLEDVFAEGFARDLAEPADGVRARVLAAIAFRGILDVWNAWYEQHAGDPELDLAEVLALKADYLERALAAGLKAIGSIPTPPVPAA
jgi:TetR/AcrR family transcriptional regulator, regulator of mycofactocin system